MVWPNATAHREHTPFLTFPLGELLVEVRAWESGGSALGRTVFLDWTFGHTKLTIANETYHIFVAPFSYPSLWCMSVTFVGYRTFCQATWLPFN